MDSSVEDVAQLFEAIAARGELEKRRLGAPSAVLDRFLEHAISTTPFYRRLGSISPSLDLFQTIAREMVSSRADDFISDRFSRSQLIHTTTSGTSGVPLSVFRDAVGSYALVYDVFRVFNEEIPELRLAPQPGSCFALVVNDNPDRNPVITVNPAIAFAYVRRIVLGNSVQSDRDQVATAKAENPPLICGRPRSLLRLAERLDEDKLAMRPRAVFSSGDNLYNSDRQKISVAFGCQVYNGYASQEGGLIALECRAGGSMHIANSARVEVLEVNGEHVAATGEGELLITNCDNWAMPLIRYRTGDVGVVEADGCSCGRRGPIITQIDGRISVYFHVGGRRINPSILNPRFEALPIRQFQVEQYATSEFRIDWVPEGKIEEKAVSDEIATFFHECTGVFPTSVTPVETIGRQGQKVQRYIRR